MAEIHIKTLPYYKIDKKYIEKILTVLQLQLTNLLNYMIVFKIIATVFNFKKAKNKLIKNVFSVDEKFIQELKQLTIKINSDLKLKNFKDTNNSFNENLNKL